MERKMAIERRRKYIFTISWRFNAEWVRQTV
jgi:hypothetical protein